MPAPSARHVRPGRILPERTASPARLVRRARSSRYPDRQAAPSARQATSVLKARRMRRLAMGVRTPTSPDSRRAEIAPPVATAARARCVAGAAARATIAHPLPAASCCVLQVVTVAKGGCGMQAARARAQRATTARPEVSAPRRRHVPRAPSATRRGSARSRTAQPARQAAHACWVRQSPPHVQLAVSPRMRACLNAPVARRASTRTVRAKQRARCALRAATALEDQRSPSHVRPAHLAMQRG